MKNPFDYIRQEREKQEAEKKERERKLAEETATLNEREEQERKRINHLRQETGKQFDGLVTDTLKLLLQAAFPDSSRQGRNWASGWEVRKHEDLSWSIGHVETQHGMSGGEWEGHITDYPVWVWEVQVTLVLDSNNKPIKFNVYRKSHGSRRKNDWGREEWVPEPIKAGLSQVELIETLKTLFSSNSAG